MATQKSGTRVGGRTIFITLIAACIGIGILFLLFYRYQETIMTSDRPNIVVVMSDDQRFDSMDAMPLTKQKLGGRGVTFSDAFIPTPLCCPSRTSFLTGLYSHNTGIWRNNPPEGGFESFSDDTSTVAVQLQQAGYKTGLFGKYINGYHKKTYVPPGWDEWNALNKGNYYNYWMNENGTNVEYGDAPEDYSGTVIKNKAIAFIKSMRLSTGPFFVVVTPNNPHGDSGRNIDEAEGARPAPEDEANCQEQPAYRPPNFNEEDMSDKPSFMKSQKPLSAKQIAAVDRFHATQICALKSLDETVEAIADALGPKRDNTIFVFYSDNGYAYGEHRNKAKNCLYEECIHVPMIISYPKVTKKARISSDLTSANIDVMATLLDYAGVKPVKPINGRSLRPVLEGTGTAIRDAVLIEANNNQTNSKNYGIRTHQYKYIEDGTGETELYDLIQDPFELVNLTNDPAYISAKTDLSARLAKMKVE
jgi:N-acetylglucosamine-6-sulfatase